MTTECLYGYLYLILIVGMIIKLMKFNNRLLFPLLLYLCLVLCDSKIEQSFAYNNPKIAYGGLNRLSIEYDFKLLYWLICCDINRVV